MKNLIITILIALTAMVNASETRLDSKIVSRVIISEAGPECSPFERYLVASVIKNRIGHKGFANGKLKTMKDVVTQKNAFECINHDANMNWKWSANPKAHFSNKAFKKAWKSAEHYGTGYFQAKENVHFFVTKGFKVPKNYVSAKYWNLKKVRTTKHFDFYSITAK